MIGFTHHTLETAPAKSKVLLQGVQQEYGFVPNLFWTMAEAPTTIEAYLTLNQLIAQTSLTSAQQQTALLAVSAINECNFCMIAHSALGKMNKVNEQTINALRHGDEIEDRQDRALAQLAQSFVRNRGWVPDADLQIFLDAGFSNQQIFEVILIVTIKTLSNYSNHITSPEPNPELLDML